MHRLFVLVTILWAAWFTPAACTHALAGNNSGQAFSIWPDTGQSKCYNNEEEIPCPASGEPFYGQDAQYQGPARSYTDLGNGTVRDNVTGLVWEQKTNMDSVANYSDPHDADNTYTWCDTDSTTSGGNQGTCGGNDTKAFIDQLNSANFGGYNDWRVPTIKELVTITNYGEYSTTDGTLEPVFGSYQSMQNFWSSTSRLSDFRE